MVNIEPIRDLNDTSLIEFCTESVAEDTITRLGIQFSLNEITEALVRYSTEPDKLCLVARDGFKIVGVILGREITYPFTKERIADQFFLRVSRDHRGNGIGKMLSDRLEDWAKSRHCKLITCGVHETVTYRQDLAKEAIMDMGFKEFSRQYYKEI